MKTIDRRKFIQQAGVATAATGAIWVAPSVLGGGSAFAAGSGPCGTMPDMSFVAGLTRATKTPDIDDVGNGAGVSGSATANGWTFAASGLTADDLLGVFTGYAGLGNRFVVERDPVSPLTNPGVTYEKSLGTLVGGRTYSFNFDLFVRNVNRYSLNMAVEIVSSTNVVTTLATYTTQNPTGSQILVSPDGSDHNYTPTSFQVPSGGGTYTFRFVFTFDDDPPQGTNDLGDDFAVSEPVVSCA